MPRFSVNVMPAVPSKLVLKSSNRLFDFLRELKEVPCGLPAATTLSLELGVSRTTVQKLIGILLEKGLVRQDGPNRILIRRPEPEDYFSADESGSSKSDQIEKLVLRKLFSYELKPGDRFSELELAREAGVSTILMREALLKIGRSGIIRKHPHQKWEVIELSKDLIEEITVVRRLFEEYAVTAIGELDGADPVWDRLRQLETAHRKLLEQDRISHSEIRSAELGFQTTVIEAARNRFITDLYQSLLTLVLFHLWQVEYDPDRTRHALKHHLAILESLLARDFDRATSEMRKHLEYARTSMGDVNRLLNR